MCHGYSSYTFDSEQIVKAVTYGEIGCYCLLNLKHRLDGLKAEIISDKKDLATSSLYMSKTEL